MVRGAGGRPRPAGQRLDRAGGRAPRRRAVDVRGADRRAPDAEMVAPVAGIDGLVAPRRPSIWPVPRSSWCRWSPGSHGCSGRSRARPGARSRDTRLDYVLIDCPPPRPADGQRPRRGARGAHPDPVRVLRAGGGGAAAAQRRSREVPSEPGPHVSTVLLTMYDARTRLASQVADEVRTHFGATVLARRSRDRCGSPRRPATASP